MVVDGRYEWAKRNGLIKDYRIEGDAVWVEYLPPIPCIKITIQDDGEAKHWWLPEKG